MLVRRPAAIVAALALSVLAACFTITFDFEAGASGVIRLELGALPPDCIDASADGVAMSREGDHCRIVIEWAGDVVDMAELRDQAAAEVEANGESLASVFLTIQSADVTVSSIALVGGDGEPVSPAPVMHGWVGSVHIAGASIVDQSGTDTADLLGRDVTVSLDEGVIADLQSAFEHGRPVRGSAHIELVVDVATLEAMAAIKGAALQLDYSIAMTVTAETEI